MRAFSLKHEMRTFHKDIFLRMNERDGKSPYLINQDICKLQSANNTKLRILIDCTSCLDRLNGGYYPEAASGGQWTTLHNFYSQLKGLCAHQEMKMIFFLDGTAPESHEVQEWLYKQFRTSNSVKSLYENFSPLKKPCIWQWTEPPFLEDHVRYEANMLPQLEKNVFAFQSIEDHPKELLDFGRQFKCDILFTNDLNVIALYLMNQKFSVGSEKILNMDLYEASSFKLTKTRPRELIGSRYSFAEVLKDYKMEAEEFAWFIVLLGHKYVSSSMLNFFYEREAGITEDFLLKQSPLRTKNLEILICLVEAVKNHVNRLPKQIDFLKSVGSLIQNDKSNEAQFTAKQLLRSIGYFQEPIPTKGLYWFYNDDDPNCFEKKKICSAIGSIYCLEQNYNLNIDSWLTKYFPAELNNLELDLKFLKKIKILTTNSMLSPWIYQLLTKQTFFISMTTEPLNQHNQVRADKIFKPIRIYLYSLIFSGFDLIQLKSMNERSELDYKDHITVEEITYDSKTEDIKRDSLLIYPFSGNELIMEQLWRMDCLYSNKFEHFLNSIQANDVGESFSYARTHTDKCNLRPVRIQYEDEFFIPCCVLRYLIQTERLLCHSDIDAFLITFVYTRSNQHRKHFNTEFRDSRAMHLGNLFMRAIEHFSFANDVCGDPIPAHLFHVGNYFNGVFFQLSYSNCQANNKEFFESLCGDEFMILEINTQVEILKKIVQFKLEDKISKTQENADFHSIKQYESRFQVSKIREQYSAERERRTGTNNGNDNFKVGEEAKNTIFLREVLERKLLEEKISPRNNKGYMGRGILARVKQSIPIANGLDESEDEEGRNSMSGINNVPRRVPHKHTKNQSLRRAGSSNTTKPKESSKPRMRDYTAINFLRRMSSDSEGERALLEEYNKDRKPLMRGDFYASFRNLRNVVEKY